MNFAERAEQLEQALAAARADHEASPAGRDGIPFELMRDTTGRYIAIEALTTLAMVRVALAAQERQPLCPYCLSAVRPCPCDSLAAHEVKVRR